LPAYRSWREVAERPHREGQSSGSTLTKESDSQHGHTAGGGAPGEFADAAAVGRGAKAAAPRRRGGGASGSDSAASSTNTNQIASPLHCKSLRRNQRRGRSKLVTHTHTHTHTHEIVTHAIREAHSKNVDEKTTTTTATHTKPTSTPAHHSPIMYTNHHHRHTVTNTNRVTEFVRHTFSHNRHTQFATHTFSHNCMASCWNSWYWC
jgi:hypothetical protein